MINHKEIGNRIKEIRIKNRLKQVGLGYKANMDDSCISRYENGEGKNLDTYELIANTLNVPLNYLLFGSKEIMYPCIKSTINDEIKLLLMDESDEFKEKIKSIIVILKEKQEGRKQ